RAAAVAATGVLVLSGCAGAGPGGSSEKPTVLTTFTVLQDMTAAVAGEHVSVESITKPGAEIHDYEPTPQDVTKASRADLVLDNGLHLEQWLEQFTSSANLTHKVVSEGVEPLDIADTPGTPNPHAWMSPRNGERYVDNIVAALSELDGEHAQQFRDNGEKYKEQIRAIGTELSKKLEALPRNERALVTCEGAFSYLA
ncbi:metal ABC transporter solute-binding protein, Zn/Mn family, partial [Corynebacterium xerosis]|uniref:metal ABC transporter solute-binding protein, Zn/Mn family n=1 Tax=Corynebacterium xerosis TaxID=1725 RepID=UPI00387A5E9C